ncbi:MAG: 2-succinyl-5-enolpyruvyl-6-hydroxy-3-cyclohexene-1-carboxylic-acid synthase [Candidatus Eisenbacteria bacterium]|uniref:2-succinyl-5-enolpyruvyl-6-hydroxy-3-cyclohexene-1-carboxylate synthase n=1 Tax=Eiseniibacteriota bacterium TaxID=2212470 RepID=A0A538T8V6_UNCEI|nr:MAG: 2-succinyl-5-enolpyruvyl-6-hydroxy-3-cyclohexene-1-carboxylic-acid synthase [Candidatus Eisenbacteria bacterium]
MPSRATESETRRAGMRSADAGAPAAEGAEPLRAPGAINLAWADRFATALHDAGVRDAVLCSGSRSAPLALAFDRSPIATHISLDERSAGFFGLGLAKASRRPVALVCTSGTAAANFFPAIIEAGYARVPLILATADRPPELRDTGAPQTIDQIKLFGSHVRWFVEVGAPEGSPTMLDYAASLGARAVAEAWRAPAGPVHLNFVFREPLLPEPDALPPAPTPAPAASIVAEPPPPAPQTVERIAKAARVLRRGLIVCGPDDSPPDLASAVAKLALVTGYPTLADPASQIRFGSRPGGPVLGGYDAFLRSAPFAARHEPELVIQFGAALTSKAFHAYTARHPSARHVIVDPGAGWRSPARRAREVVTADPTAFAEALSEALAGAADPLPSWREEFERAERAARETIARHLERARTFCEGKIFPVLLEALPETGTLYVGNSMAIRDLDAFVPNHPHRVRVLANRGANGIDGVVSSALGASAASNDPLLLVTGDLSFHHDLNALHMARGERVGATIVVVHNDGGGIFSFLPVARHAAFERYFGTPHGLDFAPAAAMYGTPYSCPRTWEELRTRAAASLRARATEVIEVRTERDGNRAWHQAVWDDVVRAVGSGS